VSADSVDPDVPSPARVWNYWLGGTDNFPVDRQLAERITAAMPLIARFARLFLDIGSGVPTADNTHQVAQRLAAESRVVYADRDATVAAHAQSLLTSTPEGKTAYLQADLRDPEAILAAAARTLDLTRPVGVLLIGVLHFIPDSDDPGQVVARLMAGLPSGSYLAIAHAASDLDPEAAAEATRRNNQTSSVPITQRTPGSGHPLLRRPGPDAARRRPDQRVGPRRSHGYRGRRPSRLWRRRRRAVVLSGSLSRFRPGGSAVPSAGSCRR
jgi:S-adenosyl methyltransferase